MAHKFMQTAKMRAHLFQIEILKSVDAVEKFLTADRVEIDHG